MLNSLRDLVWSVGDVIACVNKTSTFPFEHLYGKRMGIINEFNCHPDQVDMVKGLFEGDKVLVNIKYKNLSELERTPIYITTNKDFFMDFDAQTGNAFKQRMIISKNWRHAPFLRDLAAYPHPMAWAILYEWAMNDGVPPEPSLDVELDGNVHGAFVEPTVYRQRIAHLYGVATEVRRME